MHECKVLFVLSLLCQHAFATPLQRPLGPGIQPTFSADISDTHLDVDFLADEDRNEEMEALLNRYSPIIKLSQTERYYPSSIEYMLDHFSYGEDDDGKIIPINDTLAASTLDQFPPSYLSLEGPHNPQPWLDPRSRFLYGPAGQPGGMKRGEDGRGRVEEDIYGFWVDRGRGIVDLWYWTFYPFNFGKPVGGFGILGNHVGDWEHVRIRAINQEPVSVDFHSHEGGSFSAGTMRWGDVEKVDGRAVAYSAAGSHGLWPDAGEHSYAEVLDHLFKLVDLTDDKGAIWNTTNRVVASQYWTSSIERRKLVHGHERAWLNWRGHWGNKEDVDPRKCWWHRLIPICQTVSAPPGPNRWFGVAPDCIIAPLSRNVSSYSFYIASHLVDWARDNGVDTVQIEQICAKPRKRNEGDSPEEGEETQLGDTKISYIHDQTLEGDIEVSSMKGLTRFRGEGLHKTTILPCKPKSAIKAYRISLCLPNGKCINTSPTRKICSYEEGEAGYRLGRAVTLDDVDDWRW